MCCLRHNAVSWARMQPCTSKRKSSSPPRRVQWGGNPIDADEHIAPGDVSVGLQLTHERPEFDTW